MFSDDEFQIFTVYWFGRFSISQAIVEVYLIASVSVMVGGIGKISFNILIIIRTYPILSCQKSRIEYNGLRFIIFKIFLTTKYFSPFLHFGRFH